MAPFICAANPVSVRSVYLPLARLGVTRHTQPASRLFSLGPWTQRVKHVLRASSTSKNPVRQYHDAAGRSGASRRVGAQRMIWSIIYANIAVFGAWSYAIYSPKGRSLLEFMKNNFLLSSENLAAGRYWTTLTSAFSHTSILHLGFNMMAFHAVSTILITVPGVGALHILAITTTTALGGSYLWLKMKGQPRQSALGASGAVMGMGVTAACFFPLWPISVFFIPNVPLAVVMLGYAAFDSYNVNSMTSMIGHAAHLGGAATGLAYYGALLSNRGGVGLMLRRALRR